MPGLTRMLLACLLPRHYTAPMSQDEIDSGLPVRGRQGTNPEGKPAKDIPPALQKAEEEDALARRRRSSPALRLTAWIAAVVLLLLIFAWALQS